MIFWGRICWAERTASSKSWWKCTSPRVTVFVGSERLNQEMKVSVNEGGKQKQGANVMAGTAEEVEFGEVKRFGNDLDVCTEEGSENERHFSLRKPQRRAGPGGWTGHSEKMQDKGV